MTLTSMVNKIVFFVSSPFNERDYKRFGIETLEESGFEVEVRDFTPFLSPEVYKNYVPPDKSDFERCYVFFSREDAAASIRNSAGSCLFICMFPYIYTTYAVYRALSRKKLPYCLFAYAFPSYHFSKKKSLLSRIRNLTPRKLISYLFVRIPSRFLGIRPAAVMLALGGSIELSRLPVDKTTHVVRSHHLDYEIYLRERQSPARPGGGSGVFLDGYLPFHPDFMDNGSSRITTAEEYYPLLCGFFDFLERTYGVRIVIAANPRSDYENHPDYFGGRQVIRGRTAELVKESKFVILHETGAINFPVLFEKPMVFITTDRLERSPVGPLIAFMASLFDKRVVNLNTTLQIDLETECIVNKEAYRNYKNSYIKEDSTEETSLWQVLANHLKSSSYN